MNEETEIRWLAGLSNGEGYVVELHGVLDGDIFIVRQGTMWPADYKMYKVGHSHRTLAKGLSASRDEAIRAAKEKLEKDINGCRAIIAHHEGSLAALETL